MLFLPFLVGHTLRVQDGRGTWLAAPLLLLWLLGYFAFNALSLWLKSGHQDRYLLPVKVYGAICVCLGALLLWRQPGLVGWIMLYVPLLGIGLWRAALRDDTSLIARWVSVLAACLICAVTFSDGFMSFVQSLASHQDAYTRTARSTLVLSGYFLGTVLYVKTMIREKGEAGYIAASIGFHAFLTILAILYIYGLGWIIPVFFLVTTVRASLMPWLTISQGRKITPKQVGIVEFTLSFLLLASLTVH